MTIGQIARRLGALILLMVWLMVFPMACAEFTAPTRAALVVCFINDSTEVDLSNLDSLIVDGCKVPDEDGHHDHGHDHND